MTNIAKVPAKTDGFMKCSFDMCESDAVYKKSTALREYTSACMHCAQVVKYLTCI